MKKRVGRRKYSYIILLGIFIFVFLISPLFILLIPKPEQVLLSPSNLVNLTGKSEVIITDNKDNSSFIDYYIHTEEGRIKIRPWNNPNIIPKDLVSGEEIVVSGTLDGEVISLESSSIFERQFLQSNVASNVAAITRGNFNLGEQKTLVVPIYTTTQPSTTPQDINNSIFNLSNSNSMNSWIKEVSYNRAWLTGEVKDWIQVSGFVCSPDAMRESLIPYLQNNNINLEPYTRLIIILPEGSSCSNELAGIANIGIPEFDFGDTKIWLSTSLIKGPNNLDNGVLIHEFGHNLGLYHANFWFCNNTPPPSDICYSVPRGDPIETMGYYSEKAHFNTLHKEKIGWLKENQIINYNPKQGNYTIEPLEYANGTKMIKIPLANGLFYSIEYRRPIGFDVISLTNLAPNSYNGARVHLQKNITDGDTLLFDLETILGGNVGIAILRPGQTFTDTTNGITITTLEATPEYLKVNITGSIRCAPGDTLNPDQINCTAAIESEPKDASIVTKGLGDFNVLRNINNPGEYNSNSRSNELSVYSYIIPIGSGTSTYLSRAFLSFNTNKIPLNSNIVSAFLSIRPWSSNEYSNEQNYNFITLVSTNPSSPPNITDSDFTKLIPNTTNPTEIISSNNRHILPSNGNNNNILFNSLGISRINKSGFTNLALITGRDLFGGIQDDQEENMLTFASSNHLSVPYHPRLIVTYTLAQGCGNGILNIGEQCDDTKYNGNLDQCDNSCSLTYCGDGVIQKPNGKGTGGLLNYGYEECDGGPDCNMDCTRISQNVCTSINKCEQYTSDIDCLSDACELDFDCTWSEYDHSCHAPTCGDGLVTSGEQCELGPTSCMTPNGYSGTGECNLQCTNIHACIPDQYCGNNITDGQEVCDEGNPPGGQNGQPNHCNLQCTGLTVGSCGNGYVEGTEQCDDGNNFNGDNCLSNCTNDTCGNGYFNPLKEECDNGDNNAFCSSNCKIKPFCTPNFCQIKIPANPLDGVLSIYQPANSAPNLNFNDLRDGIGDMKRFQYNPIGYQHLVNSHVTNGASNTYHLTRAIFSFNTSVLLSSLNIDGASLSTHGRAEYAEQDNSISLVKVNLANPPDFSYQDFHNFGTETGNSQPVGEGPTTEISLDILPDHFSWINKGQGTWTNLGLVGNYDINGLPDNNSRTLQILIYQSDRQWTSTEGYTPQLVITFQAGCGNGYSETGESCDEGTNNGLPDHCNSSCTGTTLPVCGNNYLEAGEQCDDGNIQNGDRCSTNCLCSDTESGLIPGTKGTITIFGNPPASYSDSCVNKTIVNESYCDNSGALRSQQITCSQGTACTNGMCYGGGTCFLPDTLIKTKNGEKMIKDIRKGDIVLSYNEKSDKYEYNKVTKTFEHITNSYLLINNKLKVTPNHPMHINGKWQEIGSAKIGDKIKTLSGEETIFSIKEVDGDVEVYNLEVEGDHNYIAEGYLAHNKVDPRLGGRLLIE